MIFMASSGGGWHSHKSGARFHAQAGESKGKAVSRKNDTMAKAILNQGLKKTVSKRARFRNG